MPKEFTHWIIADKTLDNLDKKTEVYRILSQNRELFLLGAVLPDTPAYFAFGRKKKVLREIDKEFHDPKGGSYEPAVRALTHYINTEDDKMKSLLLGTLSHIITDAVFHPFVFHFSGNITPPDRHYRLETYIDLHFASSSDKIIRKYKALLPESKSEIKEIARFMSSYFDSDMTAGRRAFMRAIKHHAFFQSLWQNQSILRFIKKLNKISTIRLDGIIELFYPGGDCGEIFQNNYDYLHPVTGELFNTTIDILGEQAAAEAESFFNNIGNKTGTGELITFLNSQKGKNPVTGLDDGVHGEMKYFNTDIDLDEIIFS